MAGAAVAGALGSAFWPSPASAAALSEVRQFTFVDSDGIEQTCDVQIRQEFPFGDDSNQVARASTEVLGGTDESICFGLSRARLRATYTDPDGNDVTTPTSFPLGAFSVRRDYGPVGSQLRTFHQVYNDACSCFSPEWRLGPK